MLKKFKEKHKETFEEQSDKEITVRTKILSFGMPQNNDDDIYLRYGNAEKPETISNNSPLENASDSIPSGENLYGAPSNELNDNAYGYFFISEPPESKIESIEDLENTSNLASKVNQNIQIDESELRALFDRAFNRVEHEEALFIGLVQISYSSTPSNVISDSSMVPLESIINANRLKSLKTIRILYEMLKRQKLTEFDSSKIIIALLSVIRKIQLIELKDIVEEELLSEDKNIRSLSISIFGQWHEKEIIQNFDNFLLDPNPEIKIAAINALKNYKDSNFTSKILNIIESENFDVLIAIIQYFIETSNRALIEKVPYLINKLKNELENHHHDVTLVLFSFYRELMNFIRIYTIRCDYSSLFEFYMIFLEHNLDSEEITRSFIYLQQKNLPIKEILIDFKKNPRWARFKWKLEDLVRLMGL